MKSKGFKDAQKKMRGFQGRMRKVREGLFMLGVMVIYVDRLIQSLSRAWTMLNRVMGVSRVAKAAAEIQRLSEFTGVGTTRLQAFAAAAKEVGAELNDVSDLFSTVTERVDDLKSGTEKGITDDFARFGLSARDFQSATNAYEKYLVIAKRMHALNQQESGRGMALGEKALGGDISRKFGSLFEGGIAGLEALQQEAMSTGEILSDQELKVGRAFERSRLRLGRVFTAVSNQLAMTVMPQLKQVIDLVSWAGFGLSSFLKGSSQIRDTFAQYFQPFFDKVRNWITWWDASVKRIGPTILRIGVAVAGIATLLSSPKIAAAVGIFRSLGTAFLYAGVAIEDMLGFVTGLGGASAFGRLLHTSPLLQEVWLKMGATVAALGIGLSSLRRSMTVFFKGPLGVATLRGTMTALHGVASAFAVVALALEGLVRYGSMMWEMTRPLRLVAQILSGVGLIANPGAVGELGALVGAMVQDPTTYATDVLRAGAPDMLGQTTNQRYMQGATITHMTSSATSHNYGSNSAPVNANAGSTRLQTAGLQ
jgi:hypothetical protein